MAWLSEVSRRPSARIVTAAHRAKRPGAVTWAGTLWCLPERHGLPHTDRGAGSHLGGSMPMSVSVSSIEWVRQVVFTGVVTDNDLAAAYDIAARCLLDP